MSEHAPAMIREERGEDAEAVRRVLVEAFEREAEAELVERLRAGDAIAAALVAEVSGGIVGHALFTRVTAEGPGAGMFWALGPIGVEPARQGRGVGAALVYEGLRRARVAGVGAVFVLGDPEYYGRFGFVPASGWGLRCAWAVPDPVFMALELAPGALAPCAGLVRYARAFDPV